MTKPEEVIVWGLNNFSKTYIDLLIQTGINVVLIIDEYYDEKHYEAIEVKKTSFLVQQQSELNSYPVVITAQNKKGDDIYDRLHDLAKNTLEISNDILHPYFLRKFTKYRLRYRKSKHKEVIVYFHETISREYIAILQQSHIKIKLIVNDNCNIHRLSACRVLSLKGYLNTYTEYDTVPLVLFSEDIDFYTVYRRFRQYRSVRNRLMHPYFVIASLNINMHKSFLINYTIGGSGNTLVENIIVRLLQNSSCDKRAPNEEVKLLCRLSKSYYDALDAFFNGQELHGLLNEYNMTDHVRSLALHFSQRHFRLNLFGDIVKSAIFPNIGLDFFKKNNFLLFSVVRNPLDVIVSITVAHDFFRTVSEQEIHNSIEKLKYDLNYFYDVASYIHRRLTEVHNSIENKSIIKFEALRTQPVKIMRQLERVIDVPSHREDELLGIWNTLESKRLYNGGISAVGMRDPLEPRWIKYYTKAHIRILKYIGYEELLQKLGYRVALKSDIDYVNRQKVKDEACHYIKNKNKILASKEIEEVLEWMEEFPSHSFNQKEKPMFIKEYMNG